MEELAGQLATYIKPELLVLAPVLYVIGEMLKRTSIKNSRIPAILGVVSVVLCALYILGNSTITSYRDWLMAIFQAVTQGVLIAGSSVYINQLIKQRKKND